MIEENLVTISYSEAREIVSDRLSMPVTNTGVVVKMGRNEIRLFLNVIHDIFKGNIFFALVPNKSLKREDSAWIHDVNNFKIYRIDLDYLHNSNIYSEKDIFLTSSGKVSMKLLENYCVYSSKEGVTDNKEDSKEFSLKEQACLYLGVPESGTKWLDDLIKKSKNLKWDRE